jgi:hypothetical protein
VCVRSLDNCRAVWGNRAEAREEKKEGINQHFLSPFSCGMTAGRERGVFSMQRSIPECFSLSVY